MLYYCFIFYLKDYLRNKIFRTAKNIKFTNLLFKVDYFIRVSVIHILISKFKSKQCNCSHLGSGLIYGKYQ